jgi:Zn-finger nucleic acid-binding protein
MPEELDSASKELVCPKCGGAMRSHARNGVLIDQCRDCHGLFLDAGEFERLMAAETSMLGGEIAR